MYVLATNSKLYIALYVHYTVLKGIVVDFAILYNFYCFVCLALSLHFLYYGQFSLDSFLA